MHRGRRGRLSSFCLRWSASGGVLQHREGGRPAGGMDPQTHSVGCLRGANKFRGGNWLPLGFWLEDGRGSRHFPPPLFPAKLSSVLRGSTTLSPALRAELMTYNIPDVKSHWLSEHTPSSPSPFASQTRGLCLAWWAGCPSAAPAPSRQSV